MLACAPGVYVDTTHQKLGVDRFALKALPYQVFNFERLYLKTSIMALEYSFHYSLHISHIFQNDAKHLIAVQQENYTF